MTNNKPVKCLHDIFELAGSSTKLAAELDLHAYTVENWRRCGIPIKYWDKMYSLYGITPGELHSVTKACRKFVTRKDK